VADPQATTQILKPLPAPLLGDAQWLIQHPTVQTIIAVGTPAARRSIVVRLAQTHLALRYATLVHPRAWLAQRVKLGQGSVIFAGSLINVDVTIGAHASINLACTLSHDCILGDYVSLGPGVHLAGAVCTGDAADIGTGAALLPGIHLGSEVVIGAGAIVVHDLPESCTAVGVPARPARR
jgi:sugar O-acyltransferase (sialic acid O-acetyltransferase NeuD family)